MTGPEATPIDWVTISLTVPADELDLASGLLWEAGVAGIEERASDDDDDRELRAGLPADAVGAVRRMLREGWVVQVEPVPADEGLDAWREFARPWRAGSRLVVVPEWLDPPEWCRDDDLVLSIDPGRTFGSGSHPTTRMCLAELEHLVAVGDTVADFGCGSGVLTVAAVLLGAGRAVGVDIDPEAVPITLANAARNRVAEQVEVALGSLDALPAGPVDLLVANIGAEVLRSSAPAIAAELAEHGSLVLSGVLESQSDEVLAAFEAVGLELVSLAAEDDWRALVLRRPN